ncbi:unnamed protein product [Acanthoscelides obtectus]|uniref:Uncharacterized protein n=1 Tax=Acanthoscelides obtectus TaxID=200917 RepID=A0A9P0K1S0_ACAOB|nr:unnamed protein product [Acanthoscelides obtectus]CAK1669952.1 hypothetical protein AOBTE_LOCUS27320 [Acanthoscelides obtectus]
MDKASFVAEGCILRVLIQQGATVAGFASELVSNTTRDVETLSMIILLYQLVTEADCVAMVSGIIIKSYWQTASARKAENLNMLSFDVRIPNTFFPTHEQENDGKVHHLENMNFFWYDSPEGPDLSKTDQNELFLVGILWFDDGSSRILVYI